MIEEDIETESSREWNSIRKSVRMIVCEKKGDVYLNRSNRGTECDKDE